MPIVTYHRRQALLVEYDDSTHLHERRSDGYQAGSPVDLVKGVAVRMGDRGIHKVGGISLGIGLTGTLATPAASAHDGAADGLDDLRTLTIVYDKGGRRRRLFTDAVLACSSTIFEDFPISGPRTAKWLLDAWVDLETTPGRHHEHWKLLVGAEDSEVGVDEHEFLATLVDTALT